MLKAEMHWVQIISKCSEAVEWLISRNFNHYSESLRGQKHLDLINITFGTQHHALALQDGGGNLCWSLLVDHLPVWATFGYKGRELNWNKPGIPKLFSESKEELISRPWERRTDMGTWGTRQRDLNSTMIHSFSLSLFRLSDFGYHSSPCFL